MECIGKTQWKVHLAKAVDAQIRSFDPVAREQIELRLCELADNPFPFVTRVVGWEKLRSSRVADMRILCTVSDVVHVLSIERVASNH